jgi:hypothetical protein
MQLVFNFLATFTFQRKVNSNGQATLKGVHYTVGLAYAGKSVSVSFDAQQSQWVFSLQNPEGDFKEIKRQAPVEITYTQLTGFKEPLPKINQHIQLTLPLAA